MKPSPGPWRWNDMELIHDDDLLRQPVIEGHCCNVPGGHSCGTTGSLFCPPDDQELIALAPDMRTMLLQLERDLIAHGDGTASQELAALLDKLR